VLKAVTTFERLLRTLLGLAVVGLLAVGGWFGYNTFNADKLALQEKTEKLAQREKEIATLNADLKVKQQEIQRLDMALRLLKVDHRVARVEVLSQTGSAEKGDLKTRFSFAELDDHGKPLDSPRVFEVKGDLVYLDAWVIKFSDQLVESGDPEHAASIYLFRRIFGEAQQPKDGFLIDPVGAAPTPYRSGKPASEFEQGLWSRFWDYANNSKMAGQEGVRAAHGEAPSIKLMPGKRYKVLLRASGGLSIVPDEGTAASGGNPL
jgi:hypothetical protein